MGFFSALFGGGDATDPFGHGNAKDKKEQARFARGGRVKSKHAEQYANRAHSREQWRQLRRGGGGR